MTPRCICGCGERVAAKHHVVYEQTLRRVVADGRSTRMALPPPDRVRLLALTTDARNLVPVAFRCHGDHHGRARAYELGMLPDSVFEFAAEVLGPGKAFNYLRRRYGGEDARLDALVGLSAA